MARDVAEIKRPDFEVTIGVAGQLDESKILIHWRHHNMQLIVVWPGQMNWLID